jgi:hypothetical protein
MNVSVRCGEIAAVSVSSSNLSSAGVVLLSSKEQGEIISTERAEPGRTGFGARVFKFFASFVLVPLLLFLDTLKHCELVSYVFFHNLFSLWRFRYNAVLFPH